MELRDGTYTVEVTLEGGTGRASVQSPAELTVTDGTPWATVVWSSESYDLMRVGEEDYIPVRTEGGAAFVIPVPEFDVPVPVLAETTAMGTPHMIAYTLTFDASTVTESGAEAGVPAWGVPLLLGAAALVLIAVARRYHRMGGRKT